MRRLAGAAAALTIALTSCAGGAPAPPPSTGDGARATAPSAAPAPSPTAPEAEEGSLSSKESKAVARTLLRVSELRGVKATRAVPGVKLDRDKLVARVKEKALREYPAEALRREGQLLQMLGFAPATFDYLGEMMKLLEAQLEGFYEPKNGTMYLAADLRGKEAQATLAHELVHALQDQSWDLKSRSSYRPGKGDETLALACLAEGDATSVMMDFIMHEQGRTALDLPDEMVRELMASGVNGASIQSVPHILRTTLIAPYIDGLSFVHALRRKGGWAMVDRAWSQPPTTTEQVLHLDKWESHEPAIPVAAPSAAALGAGWKLDDEDTLGELGSALNFEEWLDAADARQAAAGWGGDRSAVYSKGDELAFAVHSRYDALSFSERAMQKLAPGLKKSLGKPAIDTPGAVCFERKDLGPLLFARKDRDLVMIAGPARAVATAWTSTSTCAQAKRWADEIVATR
ncbi:MAG: hypothetical protein KF764_05960 [Labilithrix sp.]|nr:hypothetical protein [Labilithrix sp.]